MTTLCTTTCDTCGKKREEWNVNEDTFEISEYRPYRGTEINHFCNLKCMLVWVARRGER